MNTKASAAVLAVLTLLALAAAASDHYSTAICNANMTSCSVVKGTDKAKGAAWGFYTDDIEKIGWGRLEVHTNTHVRDDIAVYGAGFLEGYLTATRIGQSFINYMAASFNNAPRADLLEYMENNLNWSLAFVADIDYAHPESDFDWQYRAQVGLVFAQVRGIADGYAAALAAMSDAEAASLPTLSLFDIFFLNSDGDMDDLIPAMNMGAAGGGVDLSPRRLRELELGSHCSVIVTFTSTQLWAGHEMWSVFSQMLMIYKVYDFKTSLVSTAAGSIALSSYPAYVSSEDDFYLMDSGLQVLETTNSVLNMSLYDSVVESMGNGVLLSWVRAMVANRMARTGAEWAATIPLYNSGTYNNQWIVIDHTKFIPGQPIAPDTLWIAEQIPGRVVSSDVSPVLAANGYWPSYNVPYSTEVFSLMGYPEAVSTMGNVWSYASNPRANIMRAYHTNITDDVATMQTFMSYNDYQSDPLQLGCPCFGLACRADLSPAQQKPEWGGLCSPAAFGSINRKISSSSLIHSAGAFIIAGPTTQGQPPFSWDSKWNTSSHVGMPTVYDFGWCEMQGAHVIGHM